MNFLKRLFSAIRGDVNNANDVEIVSPSMAVARKIADAFAREKVFHRLDPHGISRMSVEVNSVQVDISWYDFSSLRDIEVDRQAFIGSTREGEIIFAAAKARAKILLQEKLEALSDKMFPVIDVTDRQYSEGSDFRGLTQR